MTTFAYETQPEATYESAAFYENVASAARTGRRYQPLALLAMKAARAALSEGTKKKCSCAEGELELAFESESEWETSPRAFHQSYSAGEAAPSAALMEHLGHAAAEAESDGEAFAFLAPLLPLALKALPFASKLGLKMGAQLLPKAASAVAKVAPKLLQGVQGIARTLRRNRGGRGLMRAIPRVVQNTTAELAQQAAAGYEISPQQATQALARQTVRVLGNPRAVVACVRRANQVDRNFHQAVQQSS